MAGTDMVVIEVDTYAVYMSAGDPFRFVLWFWMPAHCVWFLAKKNRRVRAPKQDSVTRDISRNLPIFAVGVVVWW